MLPVELWWRVALYLDASDYQNLASVCSFLHRLLNEPHVQAMWILKRSDDKNAALLRSYKKGMSKVVRSILITQSGSDAHAEFNTAIVQIICRSSQISPQFSVEGLKLDVIRFVLERGRTSAAADEAVDCPTILSKQELSTLTLRWSLYFGEYSIVKYLVDDFRIPLDSVNCDFNWWTRMLRTHNFAVVALLLDREIQVVYRGNEPSEPPMPKQSGAQVRENIVEMKCSSLHYHALRVMAEEGNVGAITYLLEHTQVFSSSAVNYEMALYTILVSAASFNQVCCLDMLDRHFLNVRAVDGALDAMSVAVNGQCIEFMDSLLSRYRCSSQNVSDVELRSLVLLAVEGGRVESLRCLLRNLPIPKELLENSLLHASRLGKPEIVQLLLDIQGLNEGDMSRLRWQLSARYNQLFKAEE